MPHQGAQLAIWILVCVVLALIWIVTILLVHTLIGGRRVSQDSHAAAMRDDTAAHYGAEPRSGHLDNNFTGAERDPYHRRG